MDSPLFFVSHKEGQDGGYFKKGETNQIVFKSFKNVYVPFKLKEGEDYSDIADILEDL